MKKSLVVGVVATLALGAGCGSQAKPKSDLSLANLRSPSAAPSYFLGQTFDGLPLTAILGPRDTPSFIYGDCTPPAGFDAGGCSPPIEVQHWQLSKRPPSRIAHDIKCRRVNVRGRTAAIFESTGGVDVYVGSRTIVIFADTSRQMRRAVAALRPVKGGVLPAPPAWVGRQLARRCF